jgi:hypothetical protein
MGVSLPVIGAQTARGRNGRFRQPTLGAARESRRSRYANPCRRRSITSRHRIGAIAVNPRRSPVAPEEEELRITVGKALRHRCSHRRTIRRRRWRRHVVRGGGSGNFPPEGDRAPVDSADRRYCRCLNRSSSSRGKCAPHAGSGSLVEAALAGKPKLAALPMGTWAQAVGCTALGPALQDWGPERLLRFRRGLLAAPDGHRKRESGTHRDASQKMFHARDPPSGSA